MKEIEPFQDLRPSTAVYANQKQEYKFIGSVKLRPGEKLFQFNTSTCDIIEVNVTIDVAIDIGGNPVVKKKKHL